MGILKKIFEVMVSYINTDIKATVMGDKINVDGKKYCFINNNYDNDFATLSISVDIQPSKELGLKKIYYYIMVDEESYSSIGLMGISTVKEIGGFTNEFFAKEFTLDEETREITIK